MKGRKLPLGGSPPRRPRTESSADQPEGMSSSKQSPPALKGQHSKRGGSAAAATTTGDSITTQSPHTTSQTTATTEAAAKVAASSSSSSRSIKKSQAPPPVAAVAAAPGANPDAKPPPVAAVGLKNKPPKDKRGASADDESRHHQHQQQTVAAAAATAAGASLPPPDNNGSMNSSSNTNDSDGGGGSGPSSADAVAATLRALSGGGDSGNTTTVAAAAAVAAAGFVTSEKKKKKAPPASSSSTAIAATQADTIESSSLVAAVAAKKNGSSNSSHAAAAPASATKEKKMPPSKSSSSKATGTDGPPQPPPMLTSPGSKRSLSFDAIPPPLMALFNGRKHKVTVKVDGSVFDPHKGVSGGRNNKGGNAKSAATGLGFDGNQFYCQVCHEFGDVVCCDGCPKVYHRHCIPPEDPSTKSLFADDDPWYCPSCFPTTGNKTDKKKNKKTKHDRSSPSTIAAGAGAASMHTTPSKSRRGGDKSADDNSHVATTRAKTPSPSATALVGGGEASSSSGNNKSTSTPPTRRTTSKTQCVDCHKTADGVSMEPCEGCGNYVHYPSCRDEVAIAMSAENRVLCSTCFAVDRMTNEDEAGFAQDDDEEEEAEKLGKRAKTSIHGKEKHTKAGRLKSIQEEGDEDMDEDGEDEDMDDVEEENNNISEGRPKRRKLSTADESTVPSSKKTPGGERKRKKRKNQKPQPKNQRATSFGSAGGDVGDVGDESLIPARGGPPPPTLAQATPAFYFYLTENRWKIETVLNRKSKAFQRLSKGPVRNATVAKEAAIWWGKLRPADHKRYVNMSMRDFERRIIEWKADKNMREMNDQQGDMQVAEAGGGVGGSSSNITEQELEEGDDEQLTRDRHTRLYLSTSVGSKPFKPEYDQSYNRVLLDFLHDMRFHPLPMFTCNRAEDETEKEEASKVTIPYFDVHGPISTSVGDECLGCLRGWTHMCPVLKRRIPAIEHRAKLQPPLSSLVATRVGLGLRPYLERKRPPPATSTPEPHSWRESDETRELRELKILPSCTLSEPSDRMDDIVHFVEETIAMKVPEPPRPPPDKKKPTGRALPTQRLKDNSTEDGDGSGPVLNKCGRCRTIIQCDTGCVQCRRAQLVINMAKRQKQDGKNLKVHATMLGRVNMKEVIEIQPPGDQAFANAILKVRWAPSVILPPSKAVAPGVKRDFPALPRPQNDDSFEEDEASRAFPAESGSNDGTTGMLDLQQEDERRPRSTRATAVASDLIEPAEHQAILEKNRKQVSELQKKTVFITCCGMLHALLRRDPLLLFSGPVTAEGYSTIVKNPIDFSIIRRNVLKQKYQSVNSFANDIRQLCDNALAYNPPGSIYAKTAIELQQVLGVMQKRASKWMSAIKDAYASYLSRNEFRRRKRAAAGIADDEASEESDGDPFEELRKQWPEAVEMLDHGDWLRQQIAADFMRTRENELAYYGNLAVRRVAVAAEASLAPYTDTSGMHSVVPTRTHIQDEELRQHVDKKVTESVGPIELKEPSTWREESVHRLLRKVQSRRLDKLTASEQGCARCDGLVLEQDVKIGMKADAAVGKAKKSEENDTKPRVNSSRTSLTTGLASANTRHGIVEREKESLEEQYDSVKDSCVSVRGSKIHGWGLFADQEFQEGAVVAEYVGEYIGNSTADAREKLYQEQRIQDYLFRVDGKLVIDATMKGGHGRYANHNCSPNCFTKIIPGKEPKPHLKRVMIMALRKIDINEEITYDYQFPLELDLDARIPCNCQANDCRGFMNWDLPEKGSNNRAILVQKRGANMRDRIRRLGRPLKRDEV